MKKENFTRLKLDDRYQVLLNEASFVASRFHGSFNVHLFSLGGYYVEMWQRISLNEIVWIEILTDNTTLKEYIINIDLKKDLGIE